MSDTKKLNNCVIAFDQNDFGTYFTGQIVSGKVIITLEKTKKLKGKERVLYDSKNQPTTNMLKYKNKYGQNLV